MRISLILGHPRGESFNAAIARTAFDTLAALGHDVRFHDLYAESFDPLITAEELRRDAVLPPLVREHCDEIAAAEGIVIVHPNWWGQPPAVLKGWIDRVIRAGIAYRFMDGDQGEGIPEGLLKIQAALVINTTDTPAGREQAAFGDPLEVLWKKCVFDFCGVSNVTRKTYGVVVTSNPAQRARWLAEVQQTIRQIFPAKSE